MADPGALGLYAFAIVTWLAGITSLKWSHTSEAAVWSVGIYYGGLAQVVAGVIDLFRGEKVSGSTFVGFGFYWISIGYWRLEYGGLTPADDMYVPVMKTQGYYILAWALVAGCTFLAMLRSTYIQAVLLFLVTIDFSLIGAAHVSLNERVKEVGGYFLLVTAILAVYVGTAFLLRGKSIVHLPLFPIDANDDEE